MASKPRKAEGGDAAEFAAGAAPALSLSGGKPDVKVTR